MTIKVATGKTQASASHKKSGYSKTKSGKTKPVKTDGTEVHLILGHTKNIGNYESVKVEVGVTLPTTIDKLEKSFKMANTWCDLKLTELINDVEEALDG